MEGVIFHLNLLNQILKESHNITRIIAGGGFAHAAAGLDHPAVRQGDLLATSFHPELTGDVRLHALFVQVVRASIAAEATRGRAS